MVKIQPSFDLKHGADAAWRAERDGQLLASCSLWWNRTPPHETDRVGLIGHFNSSDAGAARDLLDFAGAELAARGCTLAVGPMDGSTWRRYRLLTDRGPLPPFFLEPDNPDDWPRQFSAGGFTPIATYTSAMTTGLHPDDERVEKVAARLAGTGFRIRPLDTSRLDEELHALFTISSESFNQNFLYHPIDEREFLDLYRPLLPLLRPELIQIAEQHGEPAAFLFALPDFNPEVFIIKTLAARPRFAGRGLGTVLIREVNRAAARLGYRRAIHALMHEENQSVRISARQAQVFRRYALFARRLTP